MAQSYVFYAGQDFDSKNLKCKKGDQLPDRWQESVLVRKLREQYGPGAVVTRERKVERKDEGKVTPAQAAAEYEKGERGKKEKKDK